jgi:hypothetical protein
MSAVWRRLRRMIFEPATAREWVALWRRLRDIEAHDRPALEAAFAATDPARRLLIVSRTDYLYQIELEAMFALALAVHGGVRPLAIVPQSSVWAPRAFDALGIHDHVRLEDLAGGSHAPRIEAAVNGLFATPPSFQRLKDFEFDGVAVGRQVLATVSRRMHRGVTTFEDPHAQTLAREMMPDALRSIVAAQELLVRTSPAVVLFNERGYAGYGSVYDVALGMGLNVIQFVAAHREDAQIFKRYTTATRAVHPFSIATDTWERVKAMPWTPDHDAALDRVFQDKYAGRWRHPSARIQANKRQADRDAVVAELGLDPRKRIAVLFSHVLWDANMFYGRDLFPDQEAWFVETVGAAIANDRLNWVVKLHPANAWKLAREGLAGSYYEVDLIRRHFGELPSHVKLMTPETTLSPLALFRAIDCGITIRGSIGYELPCFGVPVVTAGTGRYTGLGFTIDPSTPREYLDALACLEGVPRLDARGTELAKRHAFALFYLRPCRFTTFDSVFDQQAPTPLREDIEIRAQDLAGLRAAPDLRSFAAWALDSAEPDYVDPHAFARWGRV